jgi:hypothetical protein
LFAPAQQKGLDVRRTLRCVWSGLLTAFVNRVPVLAMRKQQANPGTPSGSEDLEDARC